MSVVTSNGIAGLQYPVRADVATIAVRTWPCIYRVRDLLAFVCTLQGAQEMFRNLPHEYVDVAHLKNVAQHGSESM